MRCARCAIDFPEDKRLCTACGDPLVAVEDSSTPFPRCAHCGVAVSAADRFCPGCGARHGPEPAEPSGERRPSSALPIAVAVLVGLVLVIAAGTYRQYWSGSGTAAAPRAKSVLLSSAGQVATADAIGIKVSGAGAGDPGRAEAAIRAEVERHLAELEQIYLAALRTTPAAEGVLTLHMTVASDGTVAYARGSALGLDVPGLVTAVDQHAETWRFAPSPSGLASVHYPLVFRLPTTDAAALIGRLSAAP